MAELEIIKKLPVNRPGIRVILFDFDGTISSLREGWEGIMKPLMLEMISGPAEPTPELIGEVEEYISESTGVQTIYQMRWLAGKVQEYGLNSEARGPWEYKAEYNRRLLKVVDSRLKKLAGGGVTPGDFLIRGAPAFLNALRERGFELYLASGTDHPHVLHEADILGVREYFKEIAGAPVDRADSSKKAVISHLIDERGLKGPELLIIGDGRVEIALGMERGAVTLGLASDEIKREGINAWKRERLIKAGAHAVTGDFNNYRQIFDWVLNKQ